MTDQQIAEWRKFKETLSFSPVECRVCREKLYFGNQFYLDTGRKELRFTCNCQDKVSFNGKCTECKAPVVFEPICGSAVRLRCTRGHNDVTLISKISELRTL